MKSLVLALLAVVLVLSAVSPVVGEAVEVAVAPWCTHAGWWKYQYTSWSDYTNQNCGPTSVAQVLHYLKNVQVSPDYGTAVLTDEQKILYPGVHSEARWKWSMENGVAGGWKAHHDSLTSAAHLKTALAKEGILSRVLNYPKADYGDEENECTLATLWKCVDLGKLVIVLVNPIKYGKGYTSHWVVVYGYDVDHIYMNDPGYDTGVEWGQERPVRNSKFEDAIHSVLADSMWFVVIETTLQERSVLAKCIDDGRNPAGFVDENGIVFESTAVFVEGNSGWHPFWDYPALNAFLARANRSVNEIRYLTQTEMVEKSPKSASLLTVEDFIVYGVAAKYLDGYTSISGSVFEGDAVFMFNEGEWHHLLDIETMRAFYIQGEDIIYPDKNVLDCFSVGVSYTAADADRCYIIPELPDGIGGGGDDGDPPLPPPHTPTPTPIDSIWDFTLINLDGLGVPTEFIGATIFQNPHTDEYQRRYRATNPWQRPYGNLQYGGIQRITLSYPGRDALELHINRNSAFYDYNRSVKSVYLIPCIGIPEYRIGHNFRLVIEDVRMYHSPLNISGRVEMFLMPAQPPGIIEDYPHHIKPITDRHNGVAVIRLSAEEVSGDSVATYKSTVFSPARNLAGSVPGSASSYKFVVKFEGISLENATHSCGPLQIGKIWLEHMTREKIIVYDAYMDSLFQAQADSAEAERRRQALAERRLQEKFVFLSSCDSVEDWRVSSNTCVVNLGASGGFDGTGGIGFHAQTDQRDVDRERAAIESDISPKDLSRFVGRGQFSFQFRKTASTLEMKYIRFIWGDDEDNYWTTGIGITSYENRWVKHNFPWSSARKIGNPDSSAIDFIKVEIWEFNFNGMSPYISIDDIRFEKPLPLYGDVTGDGSVTAKDASMILRHRVEPLALSIDDSLAADVSGRGGVSAFDATLVLQRAARRINEFPVEK